MHLYATGEGRLVVGGRNGHLFWERWTLDKIGIPKSTFYAWYDRYASGRLVALDDHRPRPRRVWNRFPDDVRQKVVELALDAPELSPREVPVAFTDRERSFVSEASVYRHLKARGLITSSAFIVMTTADKFANPTTAINQLWQSKHPSRAAGSGVISVQALFTATGATLDATKQAVNAVARTQGELRFVHLKYHLLMAAALTPTQSRRYAELRGYVKQ